MRRLPFLMLLLAACNGAPLPPPESFTGDVADRTGVFIIYGDTREKVPMEFWRSGADRERLLVIRRLVEEAPDFLLNSGDLVRSGKEKTWARFDREHAPIRERGIPFFAALGNHEFWGGRERGLKNFFARFPHQRGRKWYDIRYRDILLLVLDTNTDELEDRETQEQVRWMRTQLENARDEADIRCVLLCTHHPPFTNARSHTGSTWVRENVVAAVRDFPKVKACFSGHTHSYERFRVDGVHYVVSGGGGAPLVSLKSEGRHRDLYDGPRRFHYCRVVAGETIRVEVIMLDEEDRWRKVDEFELAN